jgi:hypothetical protein
MAGATIKLQKVPLDIKMVLGMYGWMIAAVIGLFALKAGLDWLGDHNW